MHYSFKLIVKRLLYFVALIGAIIAFSVYWNPVTNKINMDHLGKDWKNTTYFIDGQKVSLKDGYAEFPIENSSSKRIFRYFGNEASGDFNNDNIEDKAFLLTVETGGSGTFFYLAVAIQDKDGKYAGLNTIFLGDRIAPQTTEYREGNIIVNFAIRKAGEPMTAQPSLAISKRFIVVDNTVLQLMNNVSNDVVIIGKYICLPHKGNPEVQTLECAFGIKTTYGVNYALDLSKMPEDFAMNIIMDKEVEITGTLIPIELLSTDHWQKYDVAGILTIKKEIKN